MKLEYLFDIVEGQIKIRGRKQFDLDIKTCGWKVGKITIEKHKAKRSISQNNFYWGVIIPNLQKGMADLGNKYTQRKVHEMMEWRFLREDVPVNDSGEFTTTVRDSKDLNKEEFSIYIMEIIAWGLEYLNIEIPPPLTRQTKMKI